MIKVMRKTWNTINWSKTQEFDDNARETEESTEI